MPKSARQSEFLANYRRLETTSLDCAREHVGRLWERHQSQLVRGRTYGIGWHQADLVGATLSYVSTPSALRVACGPVSNTFRVTLHESGRINHRIDGRPAVSTPRFAVVHAPGQELRLEIEPFRLLILSFDEATVMRGLRARSERPPPPGRWPDGFALDTPAGIALRALCRWTARELDRPESGSLRSKQAKVSLERTLLTLFLDCLDEPSPAPGGREGDDLSAARVRQIEDWVAANVGEPIGVEDLAQVAGVSVRSLQVACRRVRGCTPMQLVLQRRLEAARDALLKAAPGSRVTSVAAECGFFNFGRFAAEYRSAFGESPSQTLARTDQSRR